MDSRPPTEGDPGTPLPVGPPAAPPDQGQPYGGSPYQGPPPQGRRYEGPPPQGGPSHHPPMPPIQGMPGGPPPGQPRTTSVPAVLALVFSIVGGILISVILAIVALSRIPTRNQKGKGLAIAGLVISGVWVVGLVLAAAYFDGEPERDASGQVTTTQGARPDKLRVGDCVTEINEGEVRDIKVQPCDQPNGGKVFAVFEFPAGDWPGLVTVQATAEKGCTDRWEASKQQAEQPSTIFYLHPTEEGWRLGDRGTTCLLTPK